MVLKSTVTRINQQLKALRRAERVVKGRGYYYLKGGDAPAFYTSGMYGVSFAPEHYATAARAVEALFEAEEISIKLEKS